MQYTYKFACLLRHIFSHYSTFSLPLSLFLSLTLGSHVLKEITRVGTSYIAQRRRRARSCKIAWRTNSRPSSSVCIRTFSRLVISSLITAGLTDRPIFGIVINSRCVKCVGSARIRVAPHVPASGKSLHEYQNGGHAPRRRPSLHQVSAVRSKLPLCGLYRMRHRRPFFFYCIFLLLRVRFEIFLATAGSIPLIRGFYKIKLYMYFDNVISHFDNTLYID